MSGGSGGRDGRDGRGADGPGARVVAAALAVLGVLAAGGVLADVTVSGWSTARAVVTIAFLLLGPGWAVTAALRPATLAERFVVAVGASLTVGILAGQGMVVTTAWHPGAALLVLVAASLVPLVLLARGRAPSAAATS